jgi:ribose 5-phosphate isomerase B
MRIALASDHAGYEYKCRIAEMLTAAGHEVRDFGTHSTESVDYPLYIAPAAEAVSRGECERGVVLGGSGNGEQMAANKIRGIRCALAWSLETARLARQHNDANVLAIGQRTVPVELALDLVRTWLAAEFEGGRHVPRLLELAVLEDRPDPRTAGEFPTHEKTLLIRPEFLNQRGTVFGGYMMQWADDMAFNAASLTLPRAAFVTRRVDAFDFTTPVGNGDILKVFSRVQRVGTTSCMVTVWCVNARTGEKVFSTVAVMVHIAPDGKKAPIPV